MLQCNCLDGGIEGVLLLQQLLALQELVKPLRLVFVAHDLVSRVCFPGRLVAMLPDIGVEVGQEAPKLNLHLGHQGFLQKILRLQIS